MKELYKSLLGFQSEVKHIYKGTQGYGYKYSTLDQIDDVIQPLLTKHGLIVLQPLEGTGIRTIIIHAESGESIESITEIPQGAELKGMNVFQTSGSAITYYRRYALSSFLKLITDEDADASGDQVKPPTKTSRAAYTPSKTAQASDKQKVFISNLLKQHGIDTDNMKDYLATNYGINEFMSQADAQMIIDDLNTRGEG